MVGCFGPNDDQSLVTVQQCRDFYTGCDDSSTASFDTVNAGDGDKECVTLVTTTLAI